MLDPLCSQRDVFQGDQGGIKLGTAADSLVGNSSTNRGLEVLTNGRLVILGITGSK